MEKKNYSSPVATVIGSIAGETRTGDLWKKVSGPGDQYILTDPPSCWDGHLYNNCENASA